MNIETFCYDNFINSGDVVYDIGAHTGNMSIYFLNKGAKRVYAFEPSIYNLQILKNNVKDLENVTICDVALNDKEYECLTRFRDCRVGEVLDQEQSIKYVILQNYIKSNNLEYPDFIKIDIEGMESIILKDFDFLFSGKRPIIFVEIHAAPKNEKQNYKNNPHWIWPEDGGFDFNTIKQYDYLYINDKPEVVDYSKDFNPSVGEHKGCILIPKEKFNYAKV